MSSMIKSIYIPNVEQSFTPEYIANILSVEGIANVSRITMVPVDKFDSNTMNPSKIYFKVYIEILFWHDTNKANYILNCLENNSLIPTLIYNAENLWDLKINKRPHICYTPLYKNMTTIFNPEPNIIQPSLYSQPVVLTPQPYVYYPFYNILI
jgi:hypothetical protein